MTAAIGNLTGGGTAFWVAPQVSLTCRHCVQDIGQQVTVQVAGRPFKGKVVRLAADLDAAVLAFDEPVQDFLTLLGLTDEFADLALFAAPGYPALPALDRQIDQVTVTGQIVDRNATVDGAAAVQLWVAEASAVQPLSLHGMSGAPVMVDGGPATIGLIRWSPESADLAIGGICYATPAAALVARWPDLLGPSFARPQLSGLVLGGLDDFQNLPMVRRADLKALGLANAASEAAGGKVPYIRRDCDDLLDDALRATDPTAHMLVVGEPRAGKSRSAFEALRRVRPDDRVLAPRSAATLHRALALDRQGRLTTGALVLWLDDLYRYLHQSFDSLDPESLQGFSQRRGGGLVVATIREDQRAQLSGSAIDPNQRAIIEWFEGDRGRTVFVPRLASDSERDRAHEAYPAEQFLAELGIGETLGRTSEIRARYRGETSPARRLVVEIVVDWQRVGLVDSISETRLRDLYRESRHDQAPISKDPTGEYREALDWATAPLFPGSTRLSLLRPTQSAGDVRFLADDYLVAIDDGVTVEVARPLPDRAWQPIIEAGAEDCMWGALRALERESWRVSWRAAKAATSPARLGTPQSMASLVESRADPETAEAIKQAGTVARAQGTWEGSLNCAVFSRSREDLVQCLHEAADRAPSELAKANILCVLAESLDARGETESAVALWREVGDMGQAFFSPLSLLNVTRRAPREAAALEPRIRADDAVMADAALAFQAQAQGHWKDAWNGWCGVARNGNTVLRDLAGEQLAEIAPNAGQGQGTIDDVNRELAYLKSAAASLKFAKELFSVWKMLRPTIYWYEVTVAVAERVRTGAVAVGQFLPREEFAGLEAAAAHNLGNIYMDITQAYHARWAFAHAIATGGLGSFEPTTREALRRAVRRSGYPMEGVWDVTSPWCFLCAHQARVPMHSDVFQSVMFG